MKYEVDSRFKVYEYDSILVDGETSDEAEANALPILKDLNPDGFDFEIEAITEVEPTV